MVGISSETIHPLMQSNWVEMMSGLGRIFWALMHYVILEETSPVVKWWRWSPRTTLDSFFSISWKANPIQWNICNDITETPDPFTVGVEL